MGRYTGTHVKVLSESSHNTERQSRKQLVLFLFRPWYGATWNGTHTPRRTLYHGTTEAVNTQLTFDINGNKRWVPAFSQT